MNLEHFLEQLALTSFRDWRVEFGGSLWADDVHGCHTVVTAVRNLSLVNARALDDCYSRWLHDVSQASHNAPGHDVEVRRRIVEAVGLASPWKPPSEREADAFRLLATLGKV